MKNENDQGLNKHDSAGSKPLDPTLDKLHIEGPYATFTDNSGTHIVGGRLTARGTRGTQVTLTTKEQELLDQCGPDAASHPLERVNGTIRFKGNPVVELVQRGCVNLNSLWQALNLNDKETRMGLRAFYRDMGYSLCGYIEIFGEMLDREENQEDSWH